MATKIYKYSGGRSIEVIERNPADGGASGACMRDGACQFTGTLFQCVTHWKNDGDEMAAAHARLLLAAINSQAQPRIEARNARRSFFNRGRSGR